MKTNQRRTDSRPQKQSIRILGVDPSLRSTGYAIIEGNGSKFSAVDFGLIDNPASLLPSGCLARIHARLCELIERHHPDEAAFEAVIFTQNLKTAITMGHARGAAVLACASHGIPVHEYSPRKVKSGVVGKGAAAKSQVGFMVRALLGLTQNPPFDVTDAMAVALTHGQQNRRISTGKQI